MVLQALRTISETLTPTLDLFQLRPLLANLVYWCNVPDTATRNNAFIAVLAVATRVAKEAGPDGSGGVGVAGDLAGLMEEGEEDVVEGKSHSDGEDGEDDDSASESEGEGDEKEDVKEDRLSSASPRKPTGSVSEGRAMFDGLIIGTLIPALHQGMRQDDETIRLEWVLLLASLTRLFPNHKR